jgi:hypothetical protein
MPGLRSHLTYANVVATLALVIAVGGGVAYAANTVFSSDIVNGEVKSVDLGDGEVRNPDLAADAVGSAKIADRQVKNADLGLGASSSNTIADGGIQGIDVKDGTITDADTSGLVPYGDVLWAVVDADGALDRASNGTTSSILEAADSGDYEVDFGSGGLDDCASIAQISDSSVDFEELPGQAATAQGEDSEVSIDVKTFNDFGGPDDRGFTLYVLCPEGDGMVP